MIKHLLRNFQYFYCLKIIINDASSVDLLSPTSDNHIKRVFLQKNILYHLDVLFCIFVKQNRTRIKMFILTQVSSDGATIEIIESVEVPKLPWLYNLIH